MAATCRRWRSTSSSTASAQRRCWRSFAIISCPSEKCSSPVRRPSTAKAQPLCPTARPRRPALRPVEQLRARRLQRALPRLQQAHYIDSHPGVHTRRRRDRLCANQSGSGAPRPALGQADRHPHHRLALLLHLRPAPVALQSLHRRHRHLLHAPAERAAAHPVRRRRPDPRSLLRRRHRPRQSARRQNPTNSMACPSTSAAAVPPACANSPRIIADQLDVNIEPLAQRRVPPRRDSFAHLRYHPHPYHRLRAAATIEEGIARYVDWIKTQGAVEDYFARAKPASAPRASCRASQHPSVCTEQAIIFSCPKTYLRQLPRLLRRRRCNPFTATSATCLGKLTEEQIWQRGGPHENSVGNLLLASRGQHPPVDPSRHRQSA